MSSGSRNQGLTELPRSVTRPRTLLAVDVRIGVTQAPREISVEVADDERAAVEQSVEAALGGAADVLWLTDKRGRRIAVPAEQDRLRRDRHRDGDRRIGFGG